MLKFHSIKNLTLKLFQKAAAISIMKAAAISIMKAAANNI